MESLEEMCMGRFKGPVEEDLSRTVRYCEEATYYCSKPFRYTYYADGKIVIMNIIRLLW